MLVLGPVLCILIGVVVGYLVGYDVGHVDGIVLARRAVGRIPRSCLRRYGFPLPTPPATEPSHALPPSSPES